MKIFLLLCIGILFTQCTLNYDGNTFYTIEGVIVDSLNQPAPNIDVSIRNQDGGIVSDMAISAISSTDNQGRYQLIYPKNNGVTDIGVFAEAYSRDELLEDFSDVDIPFTNNPNFQNWFFVRVTREQFTDLFFTADTIRIIPH